MPKKASGPLCNTVSCLLVCCPAPCCPVRAYIPLIQPISGLFADLEEEQRDDVVHTMFKRAVTPGETLIRQGSIFLQRSKSLQAIHHKTMPCASCCQPELCPATPECGIMGIPVAFALILRNYDVHVMLTSCAHTCMHTQHTKLVSAAEQQCFPLHTKVLF